MLTALRSILLLLVLLALAGSAAAQDTTYRIDWYLEGASQPVVTGNVLGTDMSCGPGTLPPIPGTVNNPTEIHFEHDPNQDGITDICQFDISTHVTPLGMGTYTARVRATNAAGTSADSTPSNPFARVMTPTAVGNVVIR